MLDIYFEENYGKLYEGHEQGISKVFEYSSAHGTIRTIFIKREIPIFVDGKQYYDIVTPYGYGGPIITRLESDSNKEVLVQGFIKEFKSYCIENDIVSEFVRFHPLINNTKDFKKYYNAIFMRKTVGTNLEKFDDPFQFEFSRSCRRNVRKALRNGVSYKITKSPKNISHFKDVYYSTMNRNKATDFYYFDDTYFNKCIKYFKDNLLLVEAIYQDKTIAMGFYFIYKDYIHIHLSGTLSEYLKLSPAYVLRYAVTEWGKKNGYRMIHHGGGTTNDPEDSLYKFKKQFGANTDFDFYIGKKIWNLDIYEKLCDIKKTDKNIDFFPAYRYEDQ